MACIGEISASIPGIAAFVLMVDTSRHRHPMLLVTYGRPIDATSRRAVVVVYLLRMDAPTIKHGLRMNIMELGFAFLAGLAMIASPCILMVLPILLGATLERSSRPIFIVLGFVTAFTLVALAFATGASLSGASPVLIRQVAIILLAGFSIVLLSPSLYARVSARLQSVSDLGVRLTPNPGAGKAGGFILGLSLGAVWTPCSGPVLASIIALVAGSASRGWGLVLLVAFGLGSGLPMLLIAYGGKTINTRLPILARKGAALRRGFGIATLILVAYMQWQQYDEAAGWIANRYQGWL
ncbi:cytochrome C biogenesis protein [Massilia violaceinigra]|uniref:Cytochrome C biogenesis protein n=2 Tax=Massilia violaceinigra TaxID=2045208 RepID=A0A2D2DRT9_9BURK|nr:cytochrome C biogenesis protein [Massilia violaceinigra]